MAVRLDKRLNLGLVNAYDAATRAPFPCPVYMSLGTAQRSHYVNIDERRNELTAENKALIVRLPGGGRQQIRVVQVMNAAAVRYGRPYYFRPSSQLVPRPKPAIASLLRAVSRPP